MKRTRRASTLAAGLAALALVVSACSGGSAPAATATPAPSSTATPAPSPSPTPFPTLTPTPSPTAPPAPTPTPSPAPTPFPTPTPTAAPLSKLKAYEDKTFGFSLGYPDNWQAAQGDISQGQFLFAAQGETGFPSLVVDLGFARQTGTVKEMATQLFDGLKRAVSNLSSLSEGPVKLDDGTDAYEFVIDVSSDQVPVRGKLLVVPRGSWLFEVVAQTVRSDYDTRVSDLDRIARGFRVGKARPFDVPRDQSLTLQELPPATLDPHQAGDIVSHQYVAQLFSGLVALDASLKVVPDLADRWDVSPDGRVYTFHLRSGARFHSGKPVTAQDVKYSIERAANPALQSPVPGVYLDDIVGFTDRRGRLSNDVRGVTVVDDSNVRIEIKQPVPYFLAKMAQPAGYVLNRDNVEKGGAAWFLQPDGTGPFKLKGWNPGVVMVLERSAGYYKTPAKVPFVTIWHIGGSAVPMFQAGDIDIGTVAGSDAQALQDPKHPLNGQLQVTPELSVFYIGFNNRVQPFDDARARRAFALATDRDTLIKEVQSETVRKALGFMPDGLPGFSPDLAPIPFDKAQARTLWDQVLKEKGLTLPKVTLLVGGGLVTPLHRRLALMWKDALGVDVDFRGAVTDDRAAALEQSKAHLYEFGWIADYPDPQNFLDVLFNSQAINNAGLYKSAQVDQLLEAARTDRDQANRFKTYQQVDALLLKDAAAAPLWYGRSYTLVKSFVKGWFLNSQGFADYSTVSLDRPTSV